MYNYEHQLEIRSARVEDYNYLILRSRVVTLRSMSLLYCPFVLNGPKSCDINSTYMVLIWRLGFVVFFFFLFLLAFI
jgi:hypothetical protein